jgi:hypothetical protein
MREREREDAPTELLEIPGIVPLGADYESNHVFLSVVLMGNIWKRTYEVRCCDGGCSALASYVLAKITKSPELAGTDRFVAHTSWRVSSWCHAHFASRRKNRPIVATVAEPRRIADALQSNAKANEERARQYHAQRKADELARNSRVLMCSGSAGTAWERADGTNEFRPSGGNVEPCCCESWAFWSVRARSRGHVIGKAEHDPGCANDALGLSRGRLRGQTQRPVASDKEQ